MPYITKDVREKLDGEISNLISSFNSIEDFEKQRSGILNYIVTRLLIASFKGELKYSKINDVIGALECCKMELYRRIAGKYEDGKIISNGDVTEYVEIICKYML